MKFWLKYHWFCIDGKTVLNQKRTEKNKTREHHLFYFKIYKSIPINVSCYWGYTAHENIHAYSCIYVYIRIYIHVYIHLNIHNKHICACAKIHIWICTNSFENIHSKQTHITMRTFIYTFTLYMHKHTHINI